MKTLIQLKDLVLGKTDAKNELIETDTKSVNRFTDSFLLPENIIPSEFIFGQRFFISGLKGTGKTALLRYIDLIAQKEYNAKTSFILFKSDFSEEDKTAFSRAANTYVVEDLNNTEISEGDYINVWMWFIHRQIVRDMLDNDNGFFVKDGEWEKYSQCVSAPKLGDEDAGIKRYFPKLKQGRVEIEGDLEFFKIKLGFDIDGDQTKKVNFSALVRQANELFTRLTSTPNRYLLFVDELELTLGKKKQYQKDIQLIRDLIIAINKFNIIAKKHKYNTYVIAAIRSEVITSIESSGKEINKSITDFGTTLYWEAKATNDFKTHPLIKIINKKIQAAEKFIGISQISSDDEIWKKYFPPFINKKPIYEFILNKTWYRPRDIVRLLTIAQQQFPDNEMFSSNVLEGIGKEYSRQCWVEQTEELSSTYTKEEIGAIKKILSSLECPFTLIDITHKIDYIRTIYSDVNYLLSKYRIGDILSHLFKLGIVGNTGENMRFSFRGDDELIIENSMTIHNSLWNYLSLQNKH